MAYTPVVLTKNGKTRTASTLEEEIDLRWDGWLPTGSAVPYPRPLKQLVGAETEAALGAAFGLREEMETWRLVNRMTVLPTLARRTLIKNFVASLLSAGIWDKLDGLYVLAAHDVQAAKVNWRGAGPQDLVAVNSPTFVTNQGFQGDGATSYLDTGLAGNAADNYKQDSAFAAVWSLSNQGNNTWHDLSAGGNMYINSETASAVVAIRGNNSVAPSYTAAVTDSLGSTSFSRTSSAGFTAYRNGAVLGTATAASDPLNSAPFYLLRNQSNYSGRKLALAAFGAGLTDAQVASFYSAAHTYLLAVGAVAS